MRYRVDGEMITEGERCDNLMGVPELASIFLVELKGSDLQKAASQVRSTISRLGRRIVRYRQHARIVLSRAPRPAFRHPSVRKLQDELAETGGNLRCKERELTEDI